MGVLRGLFPQWSFRIRVDGPREGRSFVLAGGNRFQMAVASRSDLLTKKEDAVWAIPLVYLKSMHRADFSYGGVYAKGDCCFGEVLANSPFDHG